MCACVQPGGAAHHDGRHNTGGHALPQNHLPFISAGHSQWKSSPAAGSGRVHDLCRHQQPLVRHHPQYGVKQHQCANGNLGAGSHHGKALFPAGRLLPPVQRGRAVQPSADGEFPVLHPVVRLCGVGTERGVFPGLHRAGVRLCPQSGGSFCGHDLHYHWLYAAQHPAEHEREPGSDALLQPAQRHDLRADQRYPENQAGRGGKAGLCPLDPSVHQRGKAYLRPAQIPAAERHGQHCHLALGNHSHVLFRGALRCVHGGIQCLQRLLRHGLRRLLHAGGHGKLGGDAPPGAGNGKAHSGRGAGNL